MPRLSFLSFCFVILYGAGVFLYVLVTGSQPSTWLLLPLLPGIAALVLGAVCEEWCRWD